MQNYILFENTFKKRQIINDERFIHEVSSTLENNFVLIYTSKLDLKAT